MAEQQDGEREPQPIDEEAAWAAIVAGYGEEPADPPGARPFRRVEDLALPEPGENGAGGADAAAPGERADGGGGKSEAGGKDGGADDAGEKRADVSEAPEKPDKFRRPKAPDEPDKPALGSSVVFAPGVGPAGPRDYSPADPDAGPDGHDEGHFVPPEPPPLPEADVTTKFAWLAAAGGPVLMLLAVLLRWDMTWWLTTLCVGGFLGGFVTLVARMKSDDEDDDGFDDPGRGAVV
ncbi:hypothetical protein ACFVQ4_10245 [Streptomyces laurentii]|uniref:hypothetical protein n=1 Tax=Streptomyces laurentii TaxID=39478 RepID=UPI003678CBDA